MSQTKNHSNKLFHTAFVPETNATRLRVFDISYRSRYKSFDDQVPINRTLMSGIVNLGAGTGIHHFTPHEMKLTPDARCPLVLVMALLMLFRPANVSLPTGPKPTCYQETNKSSLYEIVCKIIFGIHLIIYFDLYYNKEQQ